MNWETAFFIVGIVLACNLGWVINNWIRAKHGYPLEDENGEMVVKPALADEKLQTENAQLRAELENVSDRMIVLEKIVTDRGYSLADEIEALRDTSPRQAKDNGVPLNIQSREKA